IHDMIKVYQAAKDTSGPRGLAVASSSNTESSSARGGSSSSSDDVSPPPSSILEDAKLDNSPKIDLRLQDDPYMMLIGEGAGSGVIKGSGTGSVIPAARDSYLEDPTARFGLVTLLEKDPSPKDDRNNPGHWKRLTYQANGWTNNACIRLDGKESLFGV